MVCVSFRRDGFEVLRLRVGAGQPVTWEGDIDVVNFDATPFSRRYDTAVSFQQDPEEWARATAQAYDRAPRQMAEVIIEAPVKPQPPAAPQPPDPTRVFGLVDDTQLAMAASHVRPMALDPDEEDDLVVMRPHAAADTSFPPADPVVAVVDDVPVVVDDPPVVDDQVDDVDDLLESVDDLLDDQPAAAPIAMASAAVGPQPPVTAPQPPKSNASKPKKTKAPKVKKAKPAREKTPKAKMPKPAGEKTAKRSSLVLSLWRKAHPAKAPAAQLDSLPLTAADTPVVAPRPAEDRVPSPAAPPLAMADAPAAPPATTPAPARPAKPKRESLVLSLLRKRRPAPSAADADTPPEPQTAASAGVEPAPTARAEQPKRSSDAKPKRESLVLALLRKARTAQPGEAAAAAATPSAKARRGSLLGKGKTPEPVAFATGDPSATPTAMDAAVADDGSDAAQPVVLEAVGVHTPAVDVPMAWQPAAEVTELDDDLVAPVFPVLQDQPRRRSLSLPRVPRPARRPAPAPALISDRGAARRRKRLLIGAGGVAALLVVVAVASGGNGGDSGPQQVAPVVPVAPPPSATVSDDPRGTRADAGMDAWLRLNDNRAVLRLGGGLDDNVHDALAAADQLTLSCGADGAAPRYAKLRRADFLHANTFHFAKKPAGDICMVTVPQTTQPLLTFTHVAGT